MYLPPTRREEDDLYPMCPLLRGSAQDTLRGSRLRHPIFGPRTRGSPKTYYLIYDSHGHYLLATKWTSRFFDTIRVCIPAGVKEKGEPFSRTRNEHKRHAQHSRVAQFCGRGRAAENGGGLLSSFLNNTRVHTETPRGATLAELKAPHATPRYYQSTDTLGTKMSGGGIISARF